MVSARKLAANRANAQKSTGPKSINGKEKSKGNAKKHGAYATRTILIGEDKHLYEAIKEEQRALFRPRTFIQKALVDQLVSELWALRRIARAEVIHIEEVRSDLQKENYKKQENSSPDELELVHLARSSPERLEKILKRALENPDAGGRRVRLLKALASLNKRTEVSTDELYEHLFLYSSNDDTLQRLASSKRRIMKEILTLERELKKLSRQKPSDGTEG